MKKIILPVLLVVLCLTACQSPDLALENKQLKEQIAVLETKVQELATQTPSAASAPTPSPSISQPPAEVEPSEAPSVAPSVSPSPSVSQSAQPTTIPFKKLNKNADEYKGTYVKYTGKLIQVMASDGQEEYRLALDKYYNQVIYVVYYGKTDFVEDDKVTVIGTIIGAYTYESTAGYKITVPSMVADSVSKPKKK
jgi:hypothetical protein